MGKRGRETKGRAEIALDAGSTRPAESGPQIAIPSVLASVQSAAPTPSFEVDPYPEVIKKQSVGRYEVRLQHSRNWNQMQIKFGTGNQKDWPPDAVIKFLRSQEGPSCTSFRWNDEDRAWGLHIHAHVAMETRIRAEEVFQEVTKLLARERSNGMQR